MITVLLAPYEEDVVGHNVLAQSTMDVMCVERHIIMEEAASSSKYIKFRSRHGMDSTQLTAACAGSSISFIRSTVPTLLPTSKL